MLDALDHLQHQIHAGAAKPEQVGPVLADALGGKVRVGFRLPGSEVEVDADEKSIPAPAVDDIVVPVVLGDERVGVLVADQVSSRQLLREAADAAALLFEMVRLRTGLSRAVRDVESSRARLLRAGYDERHRLERDLHDGAQQRLVSLGMSLRMAQRHLTDGTIDLDGLLDDAVDQLGSAVAELRQIAHGLRPSTLDDGLGPALATLIERLPVPVVLDLTAGTVPETTATTAYFVASEAVTNAVKHASAARIDLAVWQVGDQLNVRVTDDGRGGAQVRPGAGLAGLTDRVAAAGGRLRVVSTAYRGTVIEAVLPCAS